MAEGKELSLEETAERIAGMSGYPVSLVRAQLEWLRSPLCAEWIGPRWARSTQRPLLARVAIPGPMLRDIGPRPFMGIVDYAREIRNPASSSSGRK